jgi:hypothetical protein
MQLPLSFCPASGSEQTQFGSGYLAIESHATNHQKKRPRFGRSLKLIWQRGYRGHTLWSGDSCVGRIRLAKDEDKTIYLCEAGSLHSRTDSLYAAKRWVAEQARFATLQLSLI